MEHSWWNNEFLTNFCARLYERSRENNKETHILWLGDYAELDGLSSLEGLSACFARVVQRSWLKQALQDPNRKEIDIGNTNPDFSLINKFLINTTKQEFINCTTYYNCNHDVDDWCIHPLPLLTAVGNGEGGGDYFGVNNELVAGPEMRCISMTKSLWSHLKRFFRSFVKSGKILKYKQKRAFVGSLFLFFSKVRY